MKDVFKSEYTPSKWDIKEIISLIIGYNLISAIKGYD